MDFHLPQAILKYILKLISKPSNSIINNCRGLVRDLAGITMEIDSYLLSLDHLVDHTPILWFDLVPLLHEDMVHTNVGQKLVKTNILQVFFIDQ